MVYEGCKGAVYFLLNLRANLSEVILVVVCPLLRNNGSKQLVLELECVRQQV